MNVNVNEKFFFRGLTHLILDFDGVFNDIFLEATDYLLLYKKIFASEVGVSFPEINSFVSPLFPKVLADPSIKMLVENQPTVRANASPYDINRYIFTSLLSLMREKKVEFVFDEEKIPTLERENEFLHNIHKRAYRLNQKYYRDGAKEFFQKLVNSFEVTVITSSDPVSVKERVSCDMGCPDISVIGDAKKYCVDPEFLVLPSELPLLSAQDQKILLRRKNYYLILSALKDSGGYFPEKTCVIGDIFENDLALPLYLNYYILFFNASPDNTPQFERDLVAQYNRGRVVNNFVEILKILF